MPVRRRAGKGHAPRRAGAFTLIELLVTIGIISVLMTLLMPFAADMRVKAHVLRAHNDLRTIGTAVIAYSDAERAYPPARTYCYSVKDKIDDYYELPPELEELGYLDRRMEDVFNPGGTYKYIKPGFGYANNMPTRHTIWVPEMFPKDAGREKLYRDVLSSPVKFAVWSVGPYPAKSVFEASRNHYPVPSRFWYPNRRDGIIVWLYDGDRFACSP